MILPLLLVVERVLEGNGGVIDSSVVVVWQGEAGRGEHPASGEADQAHAPLSRETPGRNGSVHSTSGEISLFLQLIYYFLF